MYPRYLIPFSLAHCLSCAFCVRVSFCWNTRSVFNSPVSHSSLNSDVMQDFNIGALGEQTCLLRGWVVDKKLYSRHTFRWIVQTPGDHFLSRFPNGFILQHTSFLKSRLVFLFYFIFVPKCMYGLLSGNLGRFSKFLEVNPIRSLIHLHQIRNFEYVT